MVVAAIALVMGASAIAGEERDGTMDILLSNPKSRTFVLLSKTGSLVMLVALATVAVWAPIHPIAAVLGVEIAGLDVEALSLHLFVNALFYGMLATAIGAMTGNRGTATGVATAIMVVSFFAVGFLPLVEGGDGLRKFLPWYYFDGSDPVTNGVAWGHIGLLVSASAVLLAVSVIGFNRRDLKGQSVGTTMLDRVRGNPLLNRLIGRLAGSARVSSIWVKTITDYQTLLLITCGVAFLMMGVMMGPMYASIPAETLTTFEQLPEQLIALFGGGDLSTPEGWYTLETFGLMAPVGVILVTAIMGAGAFAGEESRRTMGMLLANPISRSRIVFEKSDPDGAIRGSRSVSRRLLGVALRVVDRGSWDVDRQHRGDGDVADSRGLGFWISGVGAERRDGAHFGFDLWRGGCGSRLPLGQLFGSAQRCHR